LSFSPGVQTVSKQYKIILLSLGLKNFLLIHLNYIINYQYKFYYFVMKKPNILIYSTHTINNFI
jgi:hypothetical protein